MSDQHESGDPETPPEGDFLEDIPPELEGLSVEERLVVRREELAERDEADETAETYRRRVAILLALVGVLGAWIAVLQTNAATNESATARETTRTAVEAQADSVIVDGLDSMQASARAEVATLPLRATFTAELSEVLPDAQLPFTDVERVAEGLGIASETAADLLAGNPQLAFDLAVAQREKALLRDELTAERITWNARSSQYQTVITVLGVALFLIGFTLVLSRKIRPPILVPGLILVIYCFGWAVWIYNKPIPDVSGETITETATGDVQLDRGNVDGAIESLTAAIELDDSYLPPRARRAIANVTLANPDIMETFAIVDNSSEVFRAAVDDTLSALDLGGDEDITTLAVTGLIAMAANRYDIADEAVTTALELNGNAPGLYLFASAMDLANGDPPGAAENLDEALTFIEPSEPSGRIRTLAANYYSWVEWVESQNPELSEPAAELRMQMAAAEAFLVDGVVQSGESSPNASITLNGVTFDEGSMKVDLELDDVSNDDYVNVVIFERPSPGGPWVQGRQLSYIGPAVVSASSGNPIEVERACVPVEYRADLYVEGVFAGTDTAPGGEATC